MKPSGNRAVVVATVIALIAAASSHPEACCQLAVGIYLSQIVILGDIFEELFVHQGQVL